MLLKTLITSFNNRYLYSFFGVIATSDEMKGDNALQSQKNDTEKKQVLHCTRKKESTKMEKFAKIMTEYQYFFEKFHYDLRNM